MSLQREMRARRYDMLAKAWDKRGSAEASRRARLIARLIRSGLDDIDGEGWDALKARLDAHATDHTGEP